MVACWYLWKWRNKIIFEEDFQCPNNPTNVILEMAVDIDSYEQTHMTEWSHQKDIVFIGWKWPHDGWVKLNYDDAHKRSINLFGCRGLLWDSNVICLINYTRKIGACDVFHAEVWAMYLGLEQAQRRGITHLQVKIDSKVLVDMITWNGNINGSVPTLFRRICEFKNMNWHVLINHTWREGNRAADWLANFSFNLQHFWFPYNGDSSTRASKYYLWWHIRRLHASKCSFRFVVFLLGFCPLL